MMRQLGGDPVLLRAEGVSARAGTREVLSGVDLSIRRGEVVSLIGPNGAGKTTLVRVLLGLMAQYRGTVTRAPGLRVGYTPQRLSIDPVMPLTVRRFLQLSRRTAPATVAAVLREVGAQALLPASIHGLSKGELQRVLLARALLREPGLMVLDEPAQGVDVGGQAELYKLIGKVRERHGCAVLLVSHDLHVVMEAADSVVCLHRHVCCTGRPESVRQHPEYLRLFGHEAQRGLAVYTHAHDHEHDLRGNVVAESSAPASDSGASHG